MPYQDLRQFIARCEATGELVRIKEPVNPIDEMATIARESINRGGPQNRALLFENMTGYPGFPLVTNLLTNRSRLYKVMETDHEHFHADYLARSQKPVAPRLVSDGPCQDVVKTAGKFSLLEMPVPKWHAGDVGRFITAGVWVSVDPETGSRNMGIYRNQVFGDDELGVLAAPYRGLMAHARKAWAKGQRLPVAILLGPDPSVYLAAAMEWPHGTDELGQAGGMRGEPVDMVKCRTIPLEVPATTEIVIEGEMDPEWRREEGPFGEFTGYYGGGPPQPYIKVKAITHRKNPIYHAAIEGQPPSSSNVILSAQLEAELRRQVSTPGLLQVHVPSGACRMMAIAQIAKQYDGHGKGMGLAIMGTPVSRMLKTVIVVDQDVDPYNWTEVEWSMSVRLQPERDVEILKDMLGVWLDPSISPYEKETRASRTSKMVIDATQPLNLNYPPKCHFFPEVQQKVRENWSKLGMPY